jgi:hypothetical protein
MKSVEHKNSYQSSDYHSNNFSVSPILWFYSRRNENQISFQTLDNIRIPNDTQASRKRILSDPEGGGGSAPQK